MAPETKNGGFQMSLFKTVTDLTAGADLLRRRRFGVIEAANGRFRQVLLRPFPKIVSVPEALWIGGWLHHHRSGDRIRLFYNQPWRSANYLVLKYAESARDTSFGTLTRALAVLDAIARLKRSDALLCDASNNRITTKILGRWGWEPHCRWRFHRHYIKRFYGDYPPAPRWL
jgi:hypothetical protein